MKPHIDRLGRYWYCIGLGCFSIGESVTEAFQSWRDLLYKVFAEKPKCLWAAYDVATDQVQTYSIRRGWEQYTKPIEPQAKT